MYSKLIYTFRGLKFFEPNINSNVVVVMFFFFFNENIIYIILNQKLSYQYFTNYQQNSILILLYIINIFFIFIYNFKYYSLSKNHRLKIIYM